MRKGLKGACRQLHVWCYMLLYEGLSKTIESVKARLYAGELLRIVANEFARFCECLLDRLDMNWH